MNKIDNKINSIVIKLCVRFTISS